VLDEPEQVGAGGRHGSKRGVLGQPVQPKQKVVDHPLIGPITLDCDVLVVATDDVRLMIYTAEPGTDQAERLALAVVLGTQQLVE
jgi:hypothetical protein